MAPLFILYGSATGNAEHIAKELSSKFVPDNIFDSVVCVELDQYKKKCQPIWEEEPPPEKEQKYGVIIVTSTTGNGDAPENASRFFRYVKRKSTIDAAPFRHCAYAVLGLGDTNYDKFCEAGKVIDKKLTELGGTRVRALGMADEATGLEDVVEPWTQTIFDDVRKKCSPSPNNNQPHHNSNPSHANITNALAATALSDTVPTNADINHVNNHSPPTEQNPKTHEAISQPTQPISSPDVKSSASNGQHQTLPLNQKSATKAPLFILYGSATGNAEHIAKNLAEQYQNLLDTNPQSCFFPSVLCAELDQYKKKCQPIWETEPNAAEKYALIVVVSTTGNGDAPENAARFVRYIKRKTTLASKPFRHCAFAVLGLGDTNYDQFCITGKTVDSKLLELGGHRAKPLGCADEATGLEDVVEPWTANVFEDITRSCRGTTNSTAELNGLRISPTVKTVDGIDESLIHQEEEEKKTENAVTRETDPPKSNSPSALIMEEADSICIQGVHILRQIMSLPATSPFPTVSTRQLPSLGLGGKISSSCELISDLASEDFTGWAVPETDKLTATTSSGLAIHYTLKHPFESSILDARYLTNTPVQGANSASDVLNNASSLDSNSFSQAISCFDEQFPLGTAAGQISDAQCDKNGKRVIELCLALPTDFTLEYEPGDSLGLVVPNTPKVVDFVMKMLKEQHGIEESQMISVDENCPTTVADVIQNGIDLSSPIKSKRILSTLSEFATNTEERAALRLLSSKTTQGESLFNIFIEQQRRSVMDILKEFPSCQSITLEALVDTIPPIAPRYYSVSSSPLMTPKFPLRLTVAFSVVDYLTPPLPNNAGGRRRIGGLATRYLEVLCSHHLSGKKSQGSIKPVVKIFPKPSRDFHMPPNLATPMILIGPGTGVAPFMGFLSHRSEKMTANEATEAARAVSAGSWRGGFELEDDELPVNKKDASGLVLGVDFQNSQDVGEVDLFFGCRYKEHDWLFRDEMDFFKKDGILTNLWTAFSRDDRTSKKYVQTDMLENKKCGDRIVHMIMDKECIVYVCGDGNAMGRDVQNAIVELLSRRMKEENGEVANDDDREKAQKYFDDMKAKKRFRMDIWS